MFYVPDELAQPTKRSSLNLIQRFTDLFSKLNPQQGDGHRRRFRTLDPDAKCKRPSLPGRPTPLLSCPKPRSNLCLPTIQERRFLLRGSEFLPHLKTETARKPPLHHEKRLSNFKNIQKHAQKDRIARRLRQSSDSVPAQFEPWTVTDDSPAF